MNELRYQLDLMRAMNQKLSAKEKNVSSVVRYHGLCLYLLFF